VEVAEVQPRGVKWIANHTSEASVTSFVPFFSLKKEETKKLGREKSIANHTSKASVHFVHVFETANNRENEGEGRGGKQQALLNPFF
jgi:hypothetical protein